jgi:DNA-binding HxlR family transcriptional regulator
MVLDRKRRYQEFLNSDEGISTNILADRLLRLEESGLITKADDPHNKKQYLYTPTDKGLDLLPIMLDMIRWGVKHNPAITKKKPILKKMREDEEGLIRDLRAQFQKKN